MMPAPWRAVLFAGPLDGDAVDVDGGVLVPPAVVEVPAPPRLLSPHVDPRHPAAAALAPAEVVRYRLTGWDLIRRRARYVHEAAT